MASYIHLENIINAVVYSVLGIIVLFVGFLVFDKLTPYRLWDEIIVQKNVALAIVVGSLGLGMAIIVASAIH